MDGRQGKTDSTPQPCGGCPALGLGSDGDEGDETSRVDGDLDRGASNKAKASTDGALHPIHQRDRIHPRDTSLPIKCVCLHLSCEATPTLKGATPPLGESLMVNVCLYPSEATPTPKGATPPPDESLTVNGINKSVNWQSPLQWICYSTTLKGGVRQFWPPRATSSRVQRSTNCGSKTDGGITPCRTSNCQHQCGLCLWAHPFYRPLKRNQSPTATRCAPLVLPRLTPPGTC